MENLLHYFEFPFDCLAANDEAQIILPELAVPAEMIYQELKTERAPDAEQGDVHAALAEMRGSVVIVLGRFFTEKPERKTGKMPAVRGAAVRGVIGVVRRNDHAPSPGLRAARAFGAHL